jgi:ElaA protein
MNVEWRCKYFNELTPVELYEIMKLRSEVFVVEQNCVFLDADDKDQIAFHFCGWDDKNLVAYVRLLPPDSVYKEMSIGRVVTSPRYRKSGIGKKLMQQAIEMCYQLFGKDTIKIGAQLYLKKFYESFGFQQVEEMYFEDGIPHIHMILIFN